MHEPDAYHHNDEPYGMIKNIVSHTEMFLFFNF